MEIPASSASSKDSNKVPPKDTQKETPKSSGSRSTRTNNRDSELKTIMTALSALTEKLTENESLIQKCASLPEVVASQAATIDHLMEQFRGINENIPEDWAENESYDDWIENEEGYLPSAETDPVSLATLLRKDSDNNDSSEDKSLAIINRNKPPSSYGPPLSESMARTFIEVLEQPNDKKLLEKLMESYKSPENCKNMAGPRVNSELWHSYHKSFGNKDVDMRNLQDVVGTAMVIVIRMVEAIVKDRKVLPEDVADSLTERLSDAYAVMTFVFRDLTARRRSLIKKSIPPEIAALCNNQMKPTDLLFGDNFAEALKTAKSTINVTKVYTPRGRGRPHPYGPRGGGQFRGRGNRHYGYQDNNLNYQGPPQFFRGNRGGRGGRGFQHCRNSQFNSHGNYQQQQSFHQQ